MDWNARNPFCGSCGSRTLSVNAGTKRVCPPTDLANTSRPSCPTRTGISNLSFPRTDPTVIVAVCSLDGRSVLLGRQRRWPPRWYSTLAGFLEPGESVEEAVRREVWEESGVRVGRVVCHLSQPWPYPANLMLGAIAQVAVDDDTGPEYSEEKGTGKRARRPADEIDLGNDPELEDARWFPIEEVREALRHGTSGLGEPKPEGYPEDGLRLPPRTAIANQLLAAVVRDGFLAGRPGAGEARI